MKLVTIKTRERGSTPRRMKKAFNAASKEAWYRTALRFHSEYRERRFTEAHALAAGYTKRKGELIARGTKAFRQSYTGRKLRIKGHTLPLVWSGRTKKETERASISSTSKAGRATYRGANTFNFRNPKSKVRMNEEFTRLIPKEAIELGEYYDQQFDLQLKEQDK